LRTDRLKLNSSQTRIFPGLFDSLAPISEFVTHAAKVVGLDAKAVYAVQMAVDEAVTNIIEHAYGGEGRGTIECTCHLAGDGLTVTLRDHGRPFDPVSVPTPDLDADLESRRVGGLGLYFIRQLMDEVRFDFLPGSGNVLTMVKLREAGP